MKADSYKEDLDTSQGDCEVDMVLKKEHKVEMRYEWKQGRLHYIDHALEGLLDAAPSRCRLCGEALGTIDPAAGRLCLICQRNGGLNARFRTP